MIMEFDQVVREFMDYSDRDTLKAVVEATNGNQTQMLSAITSKLYEKIVEKADKIDYSSISRSRGDITKIDKFNDLVECINIIKSLVLQYNQDLTAVNTVSEAIDNLKSRSAVFQKAFVYNSPLLILTYNSIGLAIANTVSFLIAVCIEFVKNPESDSFNVALNTVSYNRAMDNVLFTNLAEFNKSCRSGEFDEAAKVLLTQTRVKKESAEVIVKPDAPFLTGDEDGEEQKTVIHDDDRKVQKESFGDSAGLIGRVLLFICKQLIYLIRNIVYYLYFWRQKYSDYWACQADLIEMNAYELQFNNTIDPDKKKEIVEKQLKIASRYKARANRWSIDSKIATKNAEKISADEAKKFKVEDLDMDTPYASSVLF